MFYQWIADSYNRKWEKGAVMFSMYDRKRLYNTYWQDKKPVILKAHLSSEAVERICKKSKAIGISVNSLLFAVAGIL